MISRKCPRFQSGDLNYSFPVFQILGGKLRSVKMFFLCVFYLVILFNKYEQFKMIDGIYFLYTFLAKQIFENLFVINKLQFH